MQANTLHTYALLSPWRYSTIQSLCWGVTFRRVQATVCLMLIWTESHTLALSATQQNPNTQANPKTRRTLISDKCYTLYAYFRRVDEVIAANRSLSLSLFNVLRYGPHIFRWFSTLEHCPTTQQTEKKINRNKEEPSMCSVWVLCSMVFVLVGAHLTHESDLGT